jgi:hypothetical protein
LPLCFLQQQATTVVLSQLVPIATIYGLSQRFCPLQEGDFLVVQRENLFMGSLYLAKGKAFEKMGNLSKI